MHRHLALFLGFLAGIVALSAGCADDTNEAIDTDDASTTTVTTPPTDGEAGESDDEPEPDTATNPDPEPMPTIGEPLPTPSPEVGPAPDVGSTFYQGVGFDLSLLGYEQTEYFLSGTARSFTNVGDLASEGRWAVEPADEADYTTRIIVIRPSDPADFNGTVVTLHRRRVIEDPASGRETLLHSGDRARAG